MLDISQSTLPARLPVRNRDCHKGEFGAVGVVGGAPGMVGAGLLAARAALFCGAGRVYAGLLDHRVAFDPAMPELMLTTPEKAMDMAAKSFAESSMDAPIARQQADTGGATACLVIGPGLGQSGEACQWMEHALDAAVPLLLDADALNLLAVDADLAGALSIRQAPTLITPHPGEAARLLGVSTREIQANRYEAILTLAQRYFASVVLKGHASLVLGEDGIPWRNTTGNPGMAAPGMGDVLCGIIAALAAQGMTLDHAAVVGVWLHGAAGDRAASEKNGPVGLTASEVAQAARDMLNSSLVNAFRI